MQPPACGAAGRQSPFRRGRPDRRETVVSTLVPRRSAARPERRLRHRVEWKTGSSRQALNRLNGYRCSEGRISTLSSDAKRGGPGTRSPSSLQSAKLGELLLRGIDHPLFGSNLLGDYKLRLRFDRVFQAEQSFDERCTNPIFFFSLFILVFALNAFGEQSHANSDDALAHPSSLDSVGDGVIAAEFGGAAIKQEGKVDAVVIIVPYVEGLFVSKDCRCKRVKSILPRHIFRVVEALVNCTPQAQCFRIARPLGIKLPKDRFGFEQRRLFVGLFGLVGRPRQLLNDVGIGLVALDGTHAAQDVTRSP